MLLHPILHCQASTTRAFSNDNNTAVANYDGYGYSYSNNALAAAGFSSGKTVTVNNISFQWPTVTAGLNDNWHATGQLITIFKSGSTLAFLGSATNGPSSGTATITYTDGTTQAFTLAFSDWTLNHGTSNLLPGNRIVATMTYRNSSTGQQARTTYVFYTSVSLTAGKIVQSVALPGTVTQGRLHIFAVGVG